MMTLVRSNRKPASAYNNVDLFGGVFDQLFNSNYTASQATSVGVNIEETEKAYVLDFLVPGYSKEQINIKVEEQVLSVEGKVEEVEEKDERNYSKREFKLASFKRSFHLPKNVEAEQIYAAFNNGILTITIPKQEKEEPKRIEIKVN